MSLSQIAELVIACIISAGGIGGIVVGVVKFSSDIIAERMAAKYELKLNKELEKYKSALESGNHISRALFDKEFQIYQSFSNIFGELHNGIQMFNALRNCNKKILNIEDLLECDMPDLLKMVQDGEIVTELQINKLYADISGQIFEFRKELARTGAFIPHDNWKLFMDLCNACHQYMKTYSEEDFKAITLMMGNMQINLRDYLTKLIVVD